MNHVKYDLSRHATKDTIKMLTFLLEKVIKSNDSVGTPTGERRKSISHAFTCFQARSIPSISIYAYLTRILKYCPCSNECFLAILVYFDRMSKLSSTRTGLRIDSFNIHRLIISGVMVASKLFSDVFFTNTRYAKVNNKKGSKKKITYTNDLFVVGGRFTSIRIKFIRIRVFVVK